jgi:hypothetical protein
MGPPRDPDEGTGAVSDFATKRVAKPHSGRKPPSRLRSLHSPTERAEPLSRIPTAPTLEVLAAASPQGH